MVKLVLGSWFGSLGSARDDVDRKKQNRRTFSGFTAVSPFRSRSNDDDDDDDGKPAIISNGASMEDNNKTASAASSTAALAAEETTDMTALALKISTETEKLRKYMEEKGLPMPSFDVDAAADFPKLPDDIQKSRLEIIYATKQLRDLVVGPRESVRWGVWDFLDVLALQIINKYELAKLVPLDGTITLAELQTRTTLDPVNLARVLRTAMTNHIFQETSPGVVAHTAASRLLATDPELTAWVGFNAEDIFPAAGAGVLPALRAHPEATSLERSGFQFAFGTVDVEPMFATFGRDAARAGRMGRAMVSLTGGEGYEVAHFVDACDLGDVDARGGTFVDVGGSHGFVCVELARRWNKMRFVVQDLQKTIDTAPRPVCERADVAERVELMPHDFFTAQTVQADVYYFRWIMHNYSTPYATDILRNLVPALKPGARIIINDHCLREPGQENAWDEKIMRRMDMVMLTLLNAQERTEAEFRELFRAADEGFVFKGVTRSKGCRMSIIEAVWKPDEAVIVDSKDQDPGVAEEKIETALDAGTARHATLKDSSSA